MDRQPDSANPAGLAGTAADLTGCNRPKIECKAAPPFLLRYRGLEEIDSGTITNGSPGSSGRNLDCLQIIQQLKNSECLALPYFRPDDVTVVATRSTELTAIRLPRYQRPPPDSLVEYRLKVSCRPLTTSDWHTCLQVAE